MFSSNTIIGNQEWCSLPELGVHAIKVRVDSGAATSAIHATNITEFEQDGQSWVEYELQPLTEDQQIVVKCQSRVLKKRRIKSSNGDVESRYVIKTPIKLSRKQWDIEVTLTNRDEMDFRMLLGRQAMEDDILISPAREFLLGDKSLQEIQKMYQKKQQSVQGFLRKLGRIVKGKLS